MSTFLEDRLARWRRSRLQTLLLVLLCACDATVEPTVLRFYVYSDVTLDHVRASLLTGEGDSVDSGSLQQVELTPIDAGAPAANLLFSIAVERTPRSKDREQAVLRLEGYDDSVPDSQIVVRQTVRAEFADNDTKLVRIWLSRACDRETSQPCMRPTEPFAATDALSRWEPGESERCTSDLACSGYCGTVEEDACARRPISCDAVDRQTDPENCGSCAMACEYPRCGDGVCTPTDFAPLPGQIEPLGSSVDLSSIYMLRIVPINSGIAAIGINSADVGAKFQLFIAVGEGRRPGPIREVAEVTVEHASTLARDGRPSGTEVIFPEPVRFTEEEQGFWIGVAAVGGGAVNVAQLKDAGLLEKVSLRDSVPARGQRFEESDLQSPDENYARPHLYVVYYP